MTKIWLGNLIGPEGEKGEPGSANPGPPGPPGPPVSVEGANVGDVYTLTGPETPGWAAPTAGSGIENAPQTWPDAFPPSMHTHPATGINDATAVGRNVLTATTQQAARQAIGAGTGNGTSDLRLGTGPTDAAPGNHGHGASAVAFTPVDNLTATDVQEAIRQAAQTGGGTGTGGASEVKVVRFASGQYPALPATKPFGVSLVLFKGPVQPTTANVSGGIPTYLGDGANQIMADYEYRALT
ncbi:hypothetical protein [Microbacterium lacus]|uniref:hypothetical protein n=1 Tax=Microbacterium lacus TaxID=415217 RepID=UPI000C2C128E|nr:hypothetical protein [Microbacterium lacus]